MTSFIDAIRIDQYNKWRKDMKINIWIHKDDIIKGNITEHYYQCPQVGYVNYVQVQVSVDEFARLEDKNIQYSASIDGPGVPIDKKDDQEYSQDNWDNAVKAKGPNPNSLKETGRSNTNYTYPEFVKEHYGE
jgi:hypothetical protein